MGLLDSKSSNPMWKKDVLENIEATGGAQMTVNGTIGKTAILLLLTVVTAFASWQFMLGLGSALYVVLFLTVLVGGGLMFWSYRNPNVAPYVAPAYAFIEGLFVGVVSAIYAMQFEGIIINAILLTFGVMFLMLFFYRTRIIKVTEKFKMVMAVAIGAIGVLYLTTWILGFFGIPIPFMHDSSLLGIGINIAVIIVASLTFLLDFDMIEKNVNNGAPKVMEWVGSMALLSTIVWLYIELLRLLSRLQD